MLSKTLFNTLLTEYTTTTKSININTLDNYIKSLELKNEFHDHNVNKIKGTIFEHIAKNYYVYNGYEVYLFNEIPIELRRTWNLGFKDMGIDLIYKDENGIWVAVQIKWRMINNETIDKNEILGFIEEVRRRKFEIKVMFTNVQNLNSYIDVEYKFDRILRK